LITTGLSDLPKFQIIDSNFIAQDLGWYLGKKILYILNVFYKHPVAFSIKERIQSSLSCPLKASLSEQGLSYGQNVGKLLREHFTY